MRNEIIYFGKTGAFVDESEDKIVEYMILIDALIWEGYEWVVALICKDLSGSLMQGSYMG